MRISFMGLPFVSSDNPKTHAADGYVTSGRVPIHGRTDRVLLSGI
jgi:hypothetical protein